MTSSHHILAVDFPASIYNPHNANSDECRCDANSDVDALIFFDNAYLVLLVGFPLSVICAQNLILLQDDTEAEFALRFPEVQCSLCIDIYNHLPVF